METSESQSSLHLSNRTISGMERLKPGDVLKKVEQCENFEVKGYHGRRQCNFAIPMKLPYGNGYGIYVENGEVRVVVDDHGAPLSVSEFANKLAQYYTALAIMHVAPQLGFNIQNVQQLQQGILIDLAR